MMTAEDLYHLHGWIATLPTVERATLLAHLQEAIAAGRLDEMACVHLTVGADGHYTLILPPSTKIPLTNAP